MGKTCGLKSYRNRRICRRYGRVRGILSVVIVVMFILPGLSYAQSTERQFQAGAATSNITPWFGLSLAGSMRDRKAGYIHDELHVRCLVLDDGKNRLAIVLCDNCLIPREVLDEAKRIANRRTNLPVERMLIAATHTHSAPSATPAFQSDPDQKYLRFMSLRIAEGIQRAIHNLTPAKIGWGVGQVPQHVFNRRWKMKPGTIPPDPFGRSTDQVKMNPCVGDPNLVEPAGPIDPEVPFISLQSVDGKPIALLANYSLHYIGGTGGAGQVSADYFAMFADRIQELLAADRLDPPFVGIMSNGTSADINNINFRGGQQRQPPYGRMRLVANDVADEVHRVCKTIQYRDWVPLDMREAKIKLGVRLPSPEDIKQAKEIVAKAKGPAMKTLPEIYARETIQMADYPEEIEVILQALRIGDLAIVAIPCEVFVETGLELKAKSPYKPIFTIELANGYNGYLPTIEQHQLGGYETWRAKSSYLAVDAELKIKAKLMELLSALESR